MQRGPSRFRRAVYGAIAGITAFGALSGLAVQAASAAPTGNNLAGADRYQTAGNLNAAKFGSGGVSTVLLADAMPGTPGSGAGGHQVDALSVGGYAGLNKYGLLLTDSTNTVPANTMSALSSLKVKNVIAVGGSAAISPAQVAQLTAAGYTVTQPFQGADRYATMQMVDSSFTPSTVGHDPSGNNTAVLASGDYAHMVDALSAGGLAYAKKFPIILTPTGSSTLGTQAQRVISNLQIKHLIVVGGTASIPASQYTPAPSGVTTVDVLSGADRSATSEAIEKADVATYGASTTKLGIAAGATFVGSTSQVQNDGADALSSAPYLGDFEPMCVTNGPTDVGSAPKCVSDVNPTTVDWLTGTANLSSSQQTTILAGSTSTTPNTYTVSGGSLTLKASTAAAPTQGVTTYTVSGLPANSTATIALFPVPLSTTKNACGQPASGAPATGSSGGTTFTAPCSGTTAVAGNAQGEGNSTFQANGTGCTSATVASNTSTAYIASVNGVPTSGCPGGGVNGPTIVYGTSTGNGTITFVVNSFQADAVTPVVYTAPSTAGTTPPLLVTAAGVPQTGYAIGVGSPSAWSAPPAPALPAGHFYVTSVLATPPVSGTNMFDAYVLGCDAPAGSCAALGGATLNQLYAFDFSAGGYYYTDKTALTQTSFGSYLSGAVPGLTQPNTTTLFQSANNAGQGGVQGDMVDVGNNGVAQSGYSPGAASNLFWYHPNELGAQTGGDVPAAPTNVNANYNGCAYTSSSTCVPGVVVTWTPPANPDVSGAQALTGATATSATYEVWASPITSGTPGAATAIGHVTVTSATVTPGTASGDLNGGLTPIGSPQFIWNTGFTAGQAYQFYVTATASTTSGGSGQSASGAATNYGPFSAASNSTTAGTSGVTTPTFAYASITPDTGCTANCNTNPGVANGTQPTVAAAGYATVYYNEPVTCLGAAGAAFSYSNSGATAITGNNCAQGAAPNELIITFPKFGTTTVGATSPSYYYTPVKLPANGDTLTYTAPGTPTTANSVFAGTTSSPSYAATSHITSNGAAGGGSTTAPADPLDPGPTITSVTSSAAAHTITLTMNEPITIGSCDTNGSDYTLTMAQGTGATAPSAPTLGAASVACANTGANGQGVVTITYTNGATPAVINNTFVVTVKVGADGDTVKDSATTVNPGIAATGNDQEVTGDSAAAALLA